MRTSGKITRLAAVAVMVAGFVTTGATGPVPVSAASSVQEVELTLSWDSATASSVVSSDGSVSTEPELVGGIAYGFCFPSTYDDLPADWWFTSSLAMQQGGALSGTCADNPAYGGVTTVPDHTFHSTLSGQVNLASVHQQAGYSSYAGAINWQLAGESERFTRDTFAADPATAEVLGTTTEQLTIIVSNPEGWYPDPDALDVPSAAGGSAGFGTAATFVYTCKATGTDTCDIGTRVEGTVDWSMSFREPTEGTGPCTPNGFVTDAFGQPVTDVRVVLSVGPQGTTTTDASGYYRFDDIGGPPTASFNPAVDTVVVGLALRESAHDPNRYVVFDRQTEAVLNAPPWRIQDRPGCRQDFDFRQPLSGGWTSTVPLADWPSLVQIYRGIGRAWALADLLGQQLTYGLPLSIQAFCTSATLDCDEEYFAFAVNSRSDGSYTTASPYIAFGTGTSALESAGWPDNREYHEFGHYFLAAALDGLPKNAGDSNHFGYKNARSTDSWTEGFAEWYSAMVSEYIDGRPDYNIYRVDGSWQINLLDPLPAWLVEELAVSSLLTSIEANPEPPVLEPVALQVTGYTVITDPQYGPVVVGGLRNNGNRTARAVRLVAGDRANTWARVGFTVPRDVQAGQTALFVILVPEVLAVEDLAVVPSETGYTRPSLPPPLQVTLQEMWDTMRTFASTKPGSNGHLFDVEDLYQALKDRWGGNSISPEGLDSVDQMFVRHGFYDNSTHATTGEYAFEAGEAVGVTSHGAFGLAELDGAACEGMDLCSPERMPRTDLEPLPAARVTVDVGVEGAAVYVQVDYPGDQAGLSYGTVAAVDADGTVAVPVPPPGSGATVTLIALADGRKPAVLAVLPADTYWDDAIANAGRPFLSFSATMSPGDIELPDLSGLPVTGPDTSVPTTSTSVPATTVPPTSPTTAVPSSSTPTTAPSTDVGPGGSGGNTGGTVIIVLAVVAGAVAAVVWIRRTKTQSPRPR